MPRSPREVLETLNAALAGRYRLDAEVGAGGMATVYRAEDLRHHRPVAIKVLRPDIAASVGAERFLREIEIAARLQHPNILPLLDSGEVEGLVFYVMPFADGPSLAERLAHEGELPIPEAIRLLVGVVDALDHAHGHGVVHRDIKPDNVMLSGRHALVTDFGVARALSASGGPASGGVTTVGLALGTPAYMAPEQAAGDPQVDHRADLYAVGILAYELLSGRPPFTGATPQQLLAAQVTQTPTPIATLRPGVSPALAEIVMRCLEKRPANRWQSARELLARLESLTTPSGGTQPTSARLPAFDEGAAETTGARSGSEEGGDGGGRGEARGDARGRDRNRDRGRAGGRSGAPKWIAASLVAVAGAAGAWWALGRGPAPLPTLGQSSRVTTGSGLATDGDISPDGSLVVYAAGGASAMRVYIQPVAGGRTLEVSEGEDALEFQPRWSPDGTRILYLARDGARVASSLGGESRLVAGRGSTPGTLSSFSGWSAPVTAAAWSPDGDRLFIGRGGSLSTVGVDGGPETPLGELPYEVHSCDWSSAGRWIACTSGNLEAIVPGRTFGNIAPSSVLLIDAVDGAIRELTDRTTVNQNPIWSNEGDRLYFVSNRQGPRDVYAVDIDADGRARGEPRRLTTGLDALSIALSGDGTRLLYVSYTAIANAWTVPIPREPISAATAEPLTTGDQVIESTLVSPDGQWVIYDSNLYGQADIFRIPLAGGSPERLTDGPADEFAGDLHPDGTRLAYHSWETGTRDIFVRELAGSVEQVTSTDAQESYPKWSPDGRRLFFFDQETVGDRPRGILVVGPREADGWGTPRLVASGASDAAWMPDARTLVVLYGEEGRVALVSVDDDTPARDLYRARPGTDDPLPGAVILSADGATVYFKAHGADERAGLWALPIAGGSPRLLVRFDDDDRQSIRRDFGAGGGRFVFTLEDRRSVLWVVDLERP